MVTTLCAALAATAETTKATPLSSGGIRAEPNATPLDNAGTAGSSNPHAESAYSPATEAEKRTVSAPTGPGEIVWGRKAAPSGQEVEPHAAAAESRLRR